MSAVYILITLGAVTVKVIGPLPITLAECESRIELWTKFYMLDPPVYPSTPPGSTYQCIQMKRKRNV